MVSTKFYNSKRKLNLSSPLSLPCTIGPLQYGHLRSLHTVLLSMLHSVVQKKVLNHPRQVFKRSRGQVKRKTTFNRSKTNHTFHLPQNSYATPFGPDRLYFFNHGYTHTISYWAIYVRALAFGLTVSPFLTTQIPKYSALTCEWISFWAWSGTIRPQRTKTGNGFWRAWRGLQHPSHFTWSQKYSFGHTLVFWKQSLPMMFAQFDSPSDRSKKWTPYRWCRLSMSFVWWLK